MDVPARWLELMGLPEGTVPLDEAALLISASANPMLDVAAELGRLDDVAARVDSPEVPALCHLLFEQIGLRGDPRNYDDPVNSYIDRVLDRGRGIPISLSVLLIEIGRRCGVPLEAVGMPGHFLVRDPATPHLLIDPFHRGRRLDHAQCGDLFHAVTGNEEGLTPAMLAPTGSFATLARMLANLDRSFDRRHDREALSWVSRLRTSVPQASLSDRAQLAARWASLGRLDAAATTFEEMAAATADDRVRDRLLATATSLRARLN